MFIRYKNWDEVFRNEASDFDTGGADFSKKEEVSEDNHEEVTEEDLDKDEDEGGAEESALLEAFQDLYDKKDDDEKEEDEEEDEDEVEDKKEEDKNEEKKEEVEDKDEDKEEEEEELVDSKGKKVSKKVSDQFNKIKESRNELRRENEELKAKLQSTETDPKESEEYKAIVEENKKLKKTIDDNFFLESDDFKKKYIIPVDKAQEELKKWIKGIPEDSVENAQKFISAMSSFVGDPDKEVEYYKAVDGFSELLNSASGGARFASAAEKWFRSSHERDKAIENKEEARKQIQSKRIEDRDDSLTTSRQRAEKAIADFNSEEEARVNFYKETLKDQFDYSEVEERSKKDIYEAVEEMVDTGGITPKMSRLLKMAYITPAIIKAEGIAHKIIKQQSSEMNKQGETIAKLEKQIEKLSGKPFTKRSIKSISTKAFKNKSSDDIDYDQDSEESALYEGLQKAGIGK